MNKGMIMNRKYRTSKFIREYGLTLAQISEKYNVSATYLRILHLQGELHKFIDEQGKKKAEVASK